MGDKTGIEWTDATWNPVTGCTKVSQGCKNCYAKHQAWHRLKASPGTVYFGREFEDVALHPERLTAPLHWTKPRRIFVNSMSDLFHEAVPVWFIDQVFAIMAADKGHTYQVLTKRPERMREYMSAHDGVGQIVIAQQFANDGRWPKRLKVQIVWPLPNVWLGVSVEDQATADERIPALLDTKAAVRWISAEPLLGPIDIRLTRAPLPDSYAPLDWVVVGGETGKGARAMDPDWARALRDQCAESSVPFFFKQWGSAGSRDERPSSGRALDGREWNEYPTTGRSLTP